MRVIVVSTHRADKAHYAPLLRCLRATPGLEVTLYAVNDAYKTPDYIDAVRPLAVTRRAVGEQHYDAGVVLGDRYEMLLAAMQLVEARIPLLHIHGGEHTYGSLDERWRYAISAIADAHCVATKDAQRELINRVPQFSRIHVTGAPGLDGITDRQPFPNAPKVVVLYNPAIDEETTRTEALMIQRAIESLGMREDVYWARPNGDRFTDFIGWRNMSPDLDAEQFRDLLAAAHVIVGNSSAGIIEAPSLGTWTVNVGERQAGRPRADSIEDVRADAASIRVAISTALAAAKRPHVNPYGDGHASERIRDVLLEMGK